VFKTIAEKLLQTGVVGVIPTDTVYGLVARAADPSAVDRLYELKNRERKPGTLIAASIEQLEELGLKHRYLKAVEQYWPGPLSVIIPCGEPSLGYLHQGVMSLAVRIPASSELAELLQKTGPLITSSANHPGEPTANTAGEARNYFGDTVDFYVDGGDLSDHEPSTIIRIVDDAIEVIREGAVKIDENGRIA
jgi:L-threonylcarbamoyladenylate synthase